MIFAITGNLLFSVALSMILGSVIVSFTSTSSLEKFEEQKEKENEKEKLKENDDKITSEDSVEPEKFEFDHKNSFLENYKSLTKEQVNGLNKDTVDLMKTQEQLIATLKDMGPVLKESQTVLDTFKSYFGNDMTNKEMNDLLTNVKNTKL
jgi:mannitol-specific phosphotransferase system IIBC component